MTSPIKIFEENNLTPIIPEFLEDLHPSGPQQVVTNPHSSTARYMGHVAPAMPGESLLDTPVPAEAASDVIFELGGSGVRDSYFIKYEITRKSIEIFTRGYASSRMGRNNVVIPTNGSYQNRPHLTSCFDIFVRINSLSSANFKYVKTQFYDRLCPNVGASSSVDETSKSSLRNPKHRYEKVSTPISCGHIPKFQQKGLIVVWPQRKKFRNWKTLALVSWFIAHTMYFLYMMNILPSARVIAPSKPPWNCKKKFRRPLRRDYIIEPDWDS